MTKLIYLMSYRLTSLENISDSATGPKYKLPHRSVGTFCSAACGSNDEKFANYPINCLLNEQITYDTLSKI